MDTQIKEILRAASFTQIFDSPQLESFLIEAAALSTKAKNAKIKNSAQAPYFSIHLSCLKNNITELDPLVLQKKSALQPKDYQIGLTALLKLIYPSCIINPETISMYYGCPTMKQLIEDIQIESKDYSPISCIASTYLIDQRAKLKLCGTIGSMALLWGHQASEIKSVTTELDPIISKPEFKKKIEDLSKLMQSEVKQTKQTKKRSVTTSRNGNLSSSTKSSSSIPTVHPLIIFNCSFSGPSFGPILYDQ